MTASTTLPMCKSPSPLSLDIADRQSWEVDLPLVLELEPCQWSAQPTSLSFPPSISEDESQVSSKSLSLSV
jgi:hypothetical protein